MVRILYKNVKSKAELNKAMAKLKKHGLNPGYTDAGAFSRSKKGKDVYAPARKKKVSGFRAKKEKMSYI